MTAPSRPLPAGTWRLLIALLGTLWRLSYQDMYDWLVAWPALARACGLPSHPDGRPRVPSASQQWKRGAHAGAAPAWCSPMPVAVLPAPHISVGGRACTCAPT